MDSYVYIWTNRIDGMRYIGKGRGKRAAMHMRRAFSANEAARTGCPRFYAAIRAHGPESFDLGYIALGLSDKAAGSVEAAFIAMYQTRREYNLTDGGEGALGAARTAETKALMSAKATGRKMSPEAVRASIEGRRGYRHSAEVRAKIAEAGRGRPASPKNVERIGRLNKKPEIEAAVAAFDGSSTRKFARLFGVSQPGLHQALKRAGWRTEGGKGKAARWLPP